MKKESTTYTFPKQIFFILKSHALCILNDSCAAPALIKTGKMSCFCLSYKFSESICQVERFASLLLSVPVPRSVGDLFADGEASSNRKSHVYKWAGRPPWQRGKRRELRGMRSRRQIHDLD